MSSSQTFLLWFGVIAPILRHVVIYNLGAAMPGDAWLLVAALFCIKGGR